MGTAGAEPLTITVEAKDLSIGDWVEPQGIVQGIDRTQRADPPLIVVIFQNDVQIFQLDEQVTVRLEDHGEEEAA